MRPTIGDAEGLAVVCVTLTVALLTFTLLHAWLRGIAERREVPRVHAATHAVANAVTSSYLDDAVTALNRLRPRTRIEVLTPFAGRVRGDSDDVVAALARATGLEALGRRWRRSRRAWRRVHGARVGMGLGAPTDDIPRLLADPDPGVAAAAADWAGQVGDVTDVDAVLDLMSAPSPLTAFAAMNAVVRLGPGAVPALEARLHLRRTRVLDHYLDVATVIGDPVFATPARKLATHPDPTVRAGVATLLGRVGDALAIDPLHQLTMAPEPEVRAAAAFALGRLHSWESAPALGLMMRDPAWIVRRAAMSALLEIGNAGQLVLRGALHDDDRFTRDIAGLALGLHPRPAAVP